MANQLTKYQLAKELGVTPNAVYAWYKGKNYPNLKNLIELANVLRISPTEVINQMQAEREAYKLAFPKS